jgi:hypothetical protein
MLRHRLRFLLRASVLLLVASAAGLGCTRGTIPILVGGDVLPSTLTAAAGVTRTPIYLFTPGPGYQFPYAVFGIPDGAALVVRQVAGVSGGEVGELPARQRGLILTGDATRLGSSLWVEVGLPSGGKGWVPSGSLTQDVPPDAFCSDPRVPTLLDAFRRAIAERDGAALQAMASPRRGLVVRYDWRNPEVAFRPEAIAELLTSNQGYDWGTQLSGGAIRGAFSELILPRLDRIAQGQPQEACDDILAGPSLRETRWPSEYQNLNYYALFAPADPGQSEYAWTTWLVGVEYLDNQPYLSHLVQLRPGV